MRFSRAALLISSLFATANVAAAAAFPPLEFLGSIFVNITAGQSIPSPEGTRVLNSWTGGYAVDPSGHHIGTIVSGEGGEGGVIDSTGIFHAHGRGALALNDGNYAFIELQGIKNGTQFFMLTADTNSATYSFLNRLFMIGNGTKTGSTLQFDIFTPGPAPLPF